MRLVQDRVQGRTFADLNVWFFQFNRSTIQDTNLLKHTIIRFVHTYKQENCIRMECGAVQTG
jgi:hypothetical protein